MLESAPSLSERYVNVRQLTLDICAHLEAEDYVVQPDADVSPPKWHLGHTTWFFERLILFVFVKNYRLHQDSFNFLFNSYYEAIGERSNRQIRGSYSRPTVKEVRDYRRVIDDRMLDFIAHYQGRSPEIDSMIELGLQHEQQHQELLWTDIKYILFFNEVSKPYLERCTDLSNLKVQTTEPTRIWHKSGLYEVGFNGKGFSFDNERPPHQVYLEAFEMANRPVTNGDFLEFIADGGYQDPRHWLADGWAKLQETKWEQPLYWQKSANGEHQVFTLYGLLPLDLDEPVTHISFYEADAFARWCDARLPNEFEWEVASSLNADAGFERSGRFSCHPNPVSESSELTAMHDNIWHWTDSTYRPYPRFRAESGLAGEYNGKFMINQMVLRGSSCVTPPSHARNTYRNYFYPDKRWQFSGFRLAW